MKQDTSLAAALRDLAFRMEKETHGITAPFTNDILDLALRAGYEEDNLTYLISCMAGTADELCERRSTPKHQINRQAGLMDLCARAIVGVPVFRHLSSRAAVLDRVERAKAHLAPRVTSDA